MEKDERWKQAGFPSPEAYGQAGQALMVVVGWVGFAVSVAVVLIFIGPP